MKQVLGILCLMVFAFASEGWADLTFPAVFKVVEEEPDQFRLTLTVPLVKGRYMKANPIVPDGFRPDGEPEARAGSASLTRSWQVDAERTSLYNEFFGLEGLLGTSTEVPTVDGKAKIKLSPGTQGGKVLRLKGKGLPDVNGYGKGDLLINVNVWTPRNLSKEERQIMEKLQKSENFGSLALRGFVVAVTSGRRVTCVYSRRPGGHHYR